MKKVLITGGAGFIGTNFVKYMKATHPDWMLVNLDVLTYAGNLANLKEFETDPLYVFVRGDITDRTLVPQLFDKYDFDYVVNFAAQSHVDRSILDPEIFLRTNVLGTQCLLDSAKAKWQVGKDEQGYPVYREGIKFLQVSTDEVYGTLEKTGKFTETTRLHQQPVFGGKASADMVVYHGKTFHLPANITRCSTTMGLPGSLKLIPLMIGMRWRTSLPVYMTACRCRLAACCRSLQCIETVLLKGRVGEVYNIGGITRRPMVRLSG